MTKPFPVCSEISRGGKQGRRKDNFFALFKSAYMGKSEAEGRLYRQLWNIATSEKRQQLHRHALEEKLKWMPREKEQRFRTDCRQMFDADAQPFFFVFASLSHPLSLKLMNDGTVDLDYTFPIRSYDMLASGAMGVQLGPGDGGLNQNIVRALYTANVEEALAKKIIDVDTARILHNRIGHSEHCARDSYYGDEKSWQYGDVCASHAWDLMSGGGETTLSVSARLEANRPPPPAPLSLSPFHSRAVVIVPLPFVLKACSSDRGALQDILPQLIEDSGCWTAQVSKQKNQHTLMALRLAGLYVRAASFDVLVLPRNAGQESPWNLFCKSEFLGKSLGKGLNYLSLKKQCLCCVGFAPCDWPLPALLCAIWKVRNPKHLNLATLKPAFPKTNRNFRKRLAACQGGSSSRKGGKTKYKENGNSASIFVFI